MFRSSEGDEDNKDLVIQMLKKNKISKDDILIDCLRVAEPNLHYQV